MYFPFNHNLQLKQNRDYFVRIMFNPIYFVPSVAFKFEFEGLLDVINFELVDFVLFD